MACIIWRSGFFLVVQDLYRGMVRICLRALLDSLASICNVLKHRGVMPTVLAMEIIC